MALAPIRDALLRLDPTGSMLTTHHLALVKLALESRSYNAIVPVIEKFILYFPGLTNQPKPKYICDMSINPVQFITPSSGLTQKLKYQEVLEYFLYSGMVFIGLSNWEGALQCLENAVTYPAKEGAVSKIMAEAYKKWILVGLLHEGRLLNLPRSTSANAAKQYHTLAKPYETLAQIFENGTAARLKAEADQGVSVWRTDCNTGLVLHVLAAYQKFQIRNLANIYSKISIPEIVSQTMSAETGNKLPSPQAGEKLVQDMINQGELHATMSSSPGQPSVVTFAVSGPVLTEPEMQNELAAATERIHSLTKEIKQTDRMLTHDKDYIKYVQKQRKNAKQGTLGDQGISGADMEWGDAIEDEDIMGNLY
jgi:COP9 signalosome complex subunit 3